MKKEFILAGLLAVGFASAQTDKDYLGKVGINIMTPQATIDIRPNDDNSQETATTNEGILIPKLSKTRVANIEDTLLVEGTLVYVTDDASSTIASYAGSNAKVAKITEKGYYYYDGTVWVKTSYIDTIGGSKWTNDATAGVVKLTNLSDGTTPRPEDKNIVVNDAGYVGVGTSAPTHALSIIGDSYDKASILIRRAYSAVRAAPTIQFEKARGTNEAKEAVLKNDSMGGFLFRGYDGSDFVSSASIYAKVDGDLSTGIMPTRIDFFNRNETESEPSVKMSLNRKGYLGLNLGGADPQLALSVANMYTGLDFIGNEGLFLVSSGNSTLNTGVRSVGSVEISSDTNANFSSATGNFEGIKFKISDTERMRISELGNVGIGTLSPTEKLDVAGNIKSTALASTGNRRVYADKDGVLKIGTEDLTSAQLAGLWVEDTATNSIKLAVNSDGTARTSAVSITDAGYVGVGTSAPTNALSIIGDSYDKASMLIRRADSNSSNSAPTLQLEKAMGTNEAKEAVAKNNALGSIMFRGYDGSDFITGGSISMRVDGDLSTGIMPTRIDFSNRGEAESQPSVKMRLNRKGYLGLNLGGADPQLALSVANIYTGLDFIENEGLFLVSRGSSALNTGVRSVGSVEISSDTNSNASSATGNFEGIKFKTSDTERMRISELGNVGIGTSAPAEKLEVNGNVKANTFIATSSGSIFPDYVFQKYYTGNSSIKSDYTFKTLSQVEDFVKTNGHLPGYKSAEAIKAQGYVDLMETQLTNVEKIEELYLHTIELKKENEELKSKNQELESRLEKLEKLLK